MNMSDAILDNRQGPPQRFDIGDQCMACDTKLSRYNPYWICGPCRGIVIGLGGDPDWAEREPKNG